MKVSLEEELVVLDLKPFKIQPTSKMKKYVENLEGARLLSGVNYLEELLQAKLEFSSRDEESDYDKLKYEFKYSRYDDHHVYFNLRF